MRSPKPSSAPPVSTMAVFWLGLALMGAVLGAWGGALTGPFLLDDLYSIVANRAVHGIGSVSEVLLPSGEAGLDGRPVLKLTFVLNHWAGGLDVRGYHLVNLLIHCVAVAALFGVARRTLLAIGPDSRLARDSLPLAFGIALLWGLHPVQTQAVTYISQRAESLMGCFYLLTLYCFVRAQTASNPRGWQAGAIIACVLGMGTKEVMVTAPVVLWLYDRTFFAKSMAGALRARPWFYAALAGTWGVLAFLLIGLAGRGVGFGLGIDAVTYALTESRVVVEYLRLAFFPHPLVFDYAPTFAQRFSDVAGYVAVVGLLIGGTIFLVVRRPSWGFLAAWFLIVLAPTSSLVPVTGSPMAESRLYLPLAAIVAGVVAGLHRLAGRRTLWAVLVVAAGFGAMVVRRNQDYSSAERIWRDTLAKQPLNARAHSNLGIVLVEQGRIAEAATAFDTSLRLNPEAPAIEHLLGNSLATTGRLEEAVTHYEHALKLHPDEVTTRFDLAQALSRLGRHDDALRQARLGVRQAPRAALAHYALALVAERRGDATTAIESYATTLQLDPGLLVARLSMGELLLAAERFSEAREQFERAVRDAPQQFVAHRGLVSALLGAGDATAAQRHASELARRFPDSPDVLFLLGRSEAACGRSAEAAAAFRHALALRPAFTEAREALSRLGGN